MQEAARELEHIKSLSSIQKDLTNEIDKEDGGGNLAPDPELPTVELDTDGAFPPVQNHVCSSRRAASPRRLPPIGDGSLLPRAELGRGVPRRFGFVRICRRLYYYRWVGGIPVKYRSPLILFPGNRFAY